MNDAERLQAFLMHEALDNIAETTLANVLEFPNGERGDNLTIVIRPMPTT